MKNQPLSVVQSLGLRSAFDGKEDGGMDGKRRQITEKYFGTSNDPDQIPIAKSTLEKLKQLSDYCINCAYDRENPVSWSIVIPTSKELMEDFVTCKITEREMFERTRVGDSGALYLCSVFTVSEFRGKGLAKELLTEQINLFLKKYPEMELFSWIYSDEGGKLIQSLPQSIVQKIRIRK